MNELIVEYGADLLKISSGTAKTIAEVREQVFRVLNIPDSAQAKLDGVAVDNDAEIPPDAQKVQFVKPSGEKA